MSPQLNDIPKVSYREVIVTLPLPDMFNRFVTELERDAQTVLHTQDENLKRQIRQKWDTVINGARGQIQDFYSLSDPPNPSDRLRL